MTHAEKNPRPSRWLRRFWNVTFLAALIAILWFGRERWLPRVGAFLNVGEPPQKTDLVLVLPGDASTRPFVAAALATRGYAERALVISTEAGPAETRGLLPANSLIERDILVARGVSPERIDVLPGRSTSTWDDATAVAEYLGRHEGKTLSVVTNDFHTRRTRWVFQRILGEEARRVRVVAAPCDGHRPDNFWRRRAGLAMYGSEYLKLVYYAGRYGGPWERMLLLGTVIGFMALLLILKRDSRGDS